MPYVNKADKQAWEEAHRPGVWRQVREATAWADAQIKTLKGMGVSHTMEEWRQLRHELRKNYLSKATIQSLSHDRK